MRLACRTAAHLLRSALCITDRLSPLFPQALQDSVIAALEATCPAATDPASQAQLRFITSALAPHTRDASSFQAAAKAWPGILHLFASLLAAFPPPDTTAGAAADTPEDSAATTAVSVPRTVTPIAASAEPSLLLSTAARLTLASLLPTPQRREWHLLFNSDMHGKSFATFFGRTTCQGPSIVVVCFPPTAQRPARSVSRPHLLHRLPSTQPLTLIRPTP